MCLHHVCHKDPKQCIVCTSIGEIKPQPNISQIETTLCVINLMSCDLFLLQNFLFGWQEAVYGYGKMRPMRADSGS